MEVNVEKIFFKEVENYIVKRRGEIVSENFSKFFNNVTVKF